MSTKRKQAVELVRNNRRVLIDFWPIGPTYEIYIDDPHNKQAIEIDDYQKGREVFREVVERYTRRGWQVAQTIEEVAV